MGAAARVAMTRPVPTGLPALRRTALVPLACLVLGACGAAVGGSGGSQFGDDVVVVGGPGFIYSGGAAAASQDNTRFGILLNDVRGDVAVQEVTFNQTLADVAQGHATDLAQNDYLSHTNLAGQTFQDRMDASDYEFDWAAENLLQGTTDEASAVMGWMDSPAHQAAMLDPRAQEFGLGLDDDIFVLIVADPAGR